MRWLKTCILVGFSLFYLDGGYARTATSNYAITQKVLRSHVVFLSSDRLQGRLTGSKGEKLATQYAADLFKRLGLEPAGDNGTFYQDFAFTSGVSLGKNNLFFITNPKGVTTKLSVNQDWRPLSFSENKSFEGAELVFAGYGIKAPASNDLPAYDSYHGLNVKNKWVLVFRNMPEKISADRLRQLSPYSSLRYKAFLAMEKGAKGILFVRGPNSKVKNELVSLSFDTTLSSAGIVAISVNDALVSELLKNSNSAFSLKRLQDKWDVDEHPPTPLFMPIKLGGRVDIQRKKQFGRNVLARLRVGKNTKSMIIIGAHVDHLGLGELSSSRSREDEIKVIHHGADDNASGVACVLEAAATLSHLQLQNKLQGRKDILFVIWSGEELGLLGSTHFIKNFMEKTKGEPLAPAIDAYINLDMVGRFKKNLVLQGVGSSLHWNKLIARANKMHPLPLITQNDPYLPTDATSFYLNGTPALNFFTGAHDEYHTPRDVFDKLNFAGMERISAFLVDLILVLEKNSNSMDYQRVATSSTHPGRGFRVYLGTIPDYASVDLVGVKLAGVTRNSPADHAGLRQDDVIVELAGKKIHDIYDYTFVLSALNAGKPVSLFVLRGHKKVVLTIVPRSRE